MPPPDPATTADAASEGPARILVVDDDPAVRGEVGSALRAAGHEVVEAGDAEEAFTKLESFVPDLILLDTDLGKESGVAMGHRIKESFTLSHVPVMFLTEKGNQQEVVDALRIGDDSIVKPFNASYLVAKVGAMVRLSAEQRRIMKQAEQFQQVWQHEQELMRQIKETKGELEQVNDLKDEFLGMAAHDLRNPLTAIWNYAEFLRDDESLPPEERREFAGEIYNLAEQMIALIGDILDISKIEAGKLDIRPIVEDMAVVIRGVAPMHRHLAQKKSIALETDLPAPLPKVHVDPERIRQVLNNMLSNAVKFSKEGDTVTIRCVPMNGFVETQVIDTGQGIPEEEIPKLFGKFQQVSSRSTAGEAGTGLGLAIVKKIVELHGGSVRVESTLGRGSTFAFTLPVADEAD